RGEARGEGRRGPRPEREPRRPQPVVDGAPAEDAVAQEAFVDTLPGPGDAPEGGEAQGERQPGRRRNRRGGRGRDRDESGAPTTESADAAPADGEPMPEAAPNGEARDPESGEAGEAGENRRRGRGRDRNRRERSPEGVTPEGVMQATDAPAAEMAAPVAEPVIEAVAVAPAVVAPAIVAEAAPEPVVVAPPMVAPVAPVVAPAALIATAPVAVTAAPFVLPTDSLQAVAEAAGLQWVNSDAEKIRAVQAAMAATPAQAHVPRERKPVQVGDEGPLVLVETRKDLSQVKLPFETQGSQPQL
ncbi:MAG: ribonuclease E/G, partial [Burkholderiales bacterium]